VLALLSSADEWWFWAALPGALVVFGWLDRRLSSYMRRYWSERGEQPPPHRTSYLDAGRFVGYAVVAGVICMLLLVDGDLLWGALVAAGAVLLGWIALVRARRNII
jgi:hypothetical protein